MDSLRKKIPIIPIQSAPPLPLWSESSLTGYAKQPLSQTLPPQQTISPVPITIPKPKKRWWKKILIVLFCLGFAWGGFFTWRVFKTSQNLSIPSSYTIQKNTPSETLAHFQALAHSLITPNTTLLKRQDERINILLLGRAGGHHSGKDLTDTIMVMSINTETKKIALLSLPRDLYVAIPHTHNFTKINDVYQQGLSQNKSTELIEETVKNVTGLPIHYSFIIDFDGFEKVVDALGGVNVEVMRDIHDTRYPGPNYSYETFAISRGWQVLNGATALKYVRERHDDPEGDFGRAKRQQQVIQAVKNKAFSLKIFADAFALNRLLTVLEKSVKTTIAPEEFESFIALSKQVDTNNITNVVIDAWKPESLLRVSHVMVGPTRMFILVPRIGNYKEIQDVASNLFDIDALKRRNDVLLTEHTSITLIDQSGNAQLATRVKKVLTESFGFQDIIIAKVPTQNNVPQDESFVFDTTSGAKPFSLDEVLKKLPIQLGSGLATPFPENTSLKQSDFVIVLGNNLNHDLDFSEDSIDDFKKAEDNPIAYPQDVIP
jgi:LCP family protein required for cell wall assembly